MTVFIRAALVAAGIGFALLTGVAGSVTTADAASYQGRASWYGPGFHGRKTASGERFNMNAMTAAHRSLPFGTKVRVTNKRNGRSVVVRINDRGPYSGGRILDVSKAAASRLGLVASGTAPVTVTVIR
ncbi:MAG: septal ring lytic transglycosylase RlpA family protein [Rhodobiaceae bacterium]|nr:septal ring lytic transglycosylase RlpA family protein [Rhodobiaceae bacterium]MCC0049556.1 septal ring lytic transglycosylase RlpA family protein [Rhodobiaceae bacterium]